MAISTLCPNCKALFKLGDELAGKQVRCQKCSQRFVVPTPTTSEPAVLPAAPPIMIIDEPPVEEAPTVTYVGPAPIVSAAPPKEEESVTAELVSAPPAPSSAKKPPPLPGTKRRDDDDENDERPRRRTLAARKPQKSGGGVGLAIGLVAALVLLLGCLGGGGFLIVNYLFDGPPPPRPPVAVGPNVPPPGDVKDGGPRPVDVMKPIEPRKQPPAPPIQVVFAPNGGYRDNNNLNAGDDQDAGVFGPRKVYHVDLTAGQTYVIEMQSAFFNSFVRILDSNNVPLAEDDNGGIGLNAKLTFVARQNGRHVVVAAARNSGAGGYTLTIRRDNPMRPIEVALGAGGVYRDDNVLRADDPLEPKRGSPAKVYRVRLQAQTKYVFEMGSRVLDSHQMLTEDNGLYITHNDDFNNLDSRIAFTPRVTATYRLWVTDLIARTGPYTVTIRREGIGEPIIGAKPPPIGKTVAFAPLKNANAIVRQLTFPSNMSGYGWSADGTHFFALTAFGQLSRVRASDFVEVKRRELGTLTQGFAISAEGPLAVRQGGDELLIVHPETLEVQRRVTAPGLRAVISHPKQSIAVGVGTTITLIDLKTGKVLSEGIEGMPRPRLLSRGALTGDGKYLFLSMADPKAPRNRGDVFAHRVKVASGKLIHDDALKMPQKRSYDFCVTPDNKYVAAFVATPLPSSLRPKETTFYPIDRWKAPAFTIRDELLALNAGGKDTLFAHTVNGRIVAYRPLGADAKALELAGPYKRVWRVHASPDGDAALVQSDTYAYHVRRADPVGTAPGTGTRDAPRE